MENKLIEILKKHKDKTFTVPEIVQIIGNAQVIPPGVIPEREFEELKQMFLIDPSREGVTHYHGAVAEHCRMIIIQELVHASEADEHDFMTIEELDQTAKNAEAKLREQGSDTQTVSE